MIGRKEEKKAYDHRNKFCVGDACPWRKAGKSGEAWPDLYIKRRPWCWKNRSDAGLCKGLGITEAVNSPTFTIIQEYTEGRLPFYHFDVYRIGDIEEMEEIGYDDYFFGEGVCLIEWAELIEELIPEGAISITIEKDLEKGFDYRKITVE